MSTRYLPARFVLLVTVASLVAPTGFLFGDEEKATAPASVTEEQPAPAKNARERKWRMRFFGAITGGNGGTVVSVGHPYSGVAVGGGGGVGINFEHRTSPRLGFELGAMAVGGNVRVGVANKYSHHVASVQADGYVPITFALNYHPPTDSEIVDFYVGPLAATTIMSSTAVGPGVWVESRVDFGLGANLGVDINFSRRSRWSFNSALKYILNFTNSGDDGNRFDLDPVIFSLGFGFRF